MRNSDSKIENVLRNNWNPAVPCALLSSISLPNILVIPFNDQYFCVILYTEAICNILHPPELHQTIRRLTTMLDSDCAIFPCLAFEDHATTQILSIILLPVRHLSLDLLVRWEASA